LAALRHIDSPERGVLLLDEDLRITFANRRAAQLLNTTVDELVGAGLPEPLTRSLASQDDVVEEVLDSAFANDHVFHRYSTPICSPAGEFTGRIEIYSDITARRELEKEILDRNRELAELNAQLEDAQEQLVQSERLRALGEMAAGVAHDINNVLGIILGNVQIARRKLEHGGDATKCIDAIELAAKDAAETVHRLREIGKPIDRSSHQTIDLSEVAEDVLKAALPAWRESGAHGEQILVETRFEPDCTVIGNASEIREALANVLLNAAQAIDGSGKIEIATSRSNGFADLTVSDTGIGMDEETRKRLFDPFFTTRGAEGTGLGMSMVDAIAIRHRGRLIVESEVGKGTSITLRIPLRCSGLIADS